MNMPLGVVNLDTLVSVDQEALAVAAASGTAEASKRKLRQNPKQSNKKKNK